LAAQTEGELGEFAPPEAYEPGSPHPYFGSENPWNQRMFGQRPADLFYKRRGQRQLLAVLEGRTEEAVRMAEARIDGDPGDLESLFLLAVARTQLGQLELAVSAMGRALAAGLPFERFLAGPQSLLKPLMATPAYQELRARLGIRLVHGPMLGDMTANQVRVWVRTAGTAEVVVQAVPMDSPGAPVRSVSFRTEEARDFSGVGTLSGLESGRTYRYWLLVDGQPVGRDSDWQFRSFPEAGRPGRFTVAFGGCAGYTPKHEKIWDAVHVARPDALLLLGDNVYLDVPEVPGAFHQYTYYRRQSRPEFRRLVSSAPVYAIWDDHDAGMDDLWLGPFPDRPAWKRPNLDFFLQNWNNPEVVDQEFPGVWHRFMIGDAEFFMLDGRNYRTNPFLPERTMLGPSQKRWLLSALRSSRATFKIIASPVNWVIGSKHGSRDTWQGFPEERREIFDFLTDHRIGGVFLLSSDRHRSDIWTNVRTEAYSLHEFGSGYLTNMHTHDTAPDAVFSYNAKNNFGLLHFDTTLTDPAVTCEFRTLDGESIHSLTLRLSELRHR